MCFELRKSDIGKKPKIAKEDIIVYKLIYKNDFGFFYNLEINNKKEKWTQGYIYSESDPFDIYFDIIKGRCFHNCKTLEEARYYMKYLNYNTNKIVKMIIPKGAKYYNTNKIVKMIIPKGEKYYENDYEYVSDTIYYPLQDKKMNLL